MNKLTVFLFLLLSFPVTISAQNSRADGVVQSRSGFPAPGAQIAVCTQPATTTTAPCSPLASLCSSATDAACVSANPVTADGLGNYSFYVKPGKYTVQFYGSGLTARVQPDQILACDPSNCTINGTITVANIDNRIYVDGVKYPITQAGVQQAINDACNNFTTGLSGGTTVYLPPGQIALHNQASQLLLIPCAISLEGAGSGGTTQLVADLGIANTIHWIRFQPTANRGNGFRLRDIQLVSATPGTPTGGAGLMLDGSSTLSQTPVFIDIGPHFVVGTNTIGTLAIDTVNLATSPAGGLLWHIHDNSLNGGVRLTGLADSLMFDHNEVNTNSGSTSPCVDFTAASGAAQQNFTNNWTGGNSCAGGMMIIHCGGQVTVKENQFEQIIASTEANSAMIDLQGDVCQLNNIWIMDNNLNTHNNVTNNVRVDNATGAFINGNAFSVTATTGVGILMTANALNTHWFWNDYGTISGGNARWANASNTSTYASQGPDGSQIGPTYSWANNPNDGMYHRATVIEFSLSGNSVTQLNGNGVNVGESGGIATVGYVNGSTVSVPPDLSTSRGAAGFMVVGNGTPGNATGLIAADGNNVYLTADWTCGTTGTVASCVAATIVGSGGGVPLTFTLPLVARSWRWECDGVVGQATGATANQWNILTATNGATNITANYTMGTAATAMAVGAVTDQASTTTTFQIAPSWTLGGTGTKMPFHIWGRVEGASASGTVLSLQLVAPTVGDLVTIYRGSGCHIF